MGSNITCYHIPATPTTNGSFIQHKDAAEMFCPKHSHSLNNWLQLISFRISSCVLAMSLSVRGVPGDLFMALLKACCTCSARARPVHDADTAMRATPHAWGCALGAHPSTGHALGRGRQRAEEEEEATSARRRSKAVNNGILIKS